MAATTLYNKWRPKRFADVVGQDPIIQTLRNAVLQDKLSHAYLFSGPRGTGKTTTARIFAKALMLGHDADGDPPTDSPDVREPSTTACIPTSSRWTPPPTAASTTSAN